MIENYKKIYNNNKNVDLGIYNVYTIGETRLFNMQVKLQKWGNSDGIRIPSSFLKSLNLKTNDKVELIQEKDRIIIRKPIKEKISLEEKFLNYKGDNLAKDFTWDEPKGKEIW